jgi:hypothetical protein
MSFSTPVIFLICVYAILIPLTAIIVFVLWLTGVIEHSPRHLLKPPPPAEYSRIDLRRFAPRHLLPKPPEKPPYVPQMRWHFTDFPDDEDVPHLVELWLALSEEEYKLIRRFELNKEPLEEEAVYDEVAIAAIRRAQAAEIERAGKDTKHIARLKMEHEQQLEYVEKQTFGRTIEYYIQWPYRREFDTRTQARLYWDKLDEKVLPDFKRRLDRYARRG